MRVLLFVALALCVASAAAHPLTEDQYQGLFTSWMAKHEKQYDTPAETFQRFNIWKDNFDFVVKHNLEAEAGQHTFTLDTNHLADMTNEEYRNTMLGLKRGDRPAPEYKGTTDVDVSGIPTAFDWRTKGAVNPVKNQGQCGSCWSFSATAAMEGFHWQTTGKLMSFSEQMCVDCVNGGADTCSVGGEMHDCYLEILKLGGEETEATYPYLGTSGHKCGYSKSNSVPVSFTGYQNVTSGDENSLLQASSKVPIVSVGIDASSIWFQLYSTGVFNVASCKKAYNQLDHGVAVVGWGNDATGGDYWLVRNSWGATWGKAGYIWMSRNKDNQCGIATDATFPTK